MSTRKVRIEERATKERGKIFQMKYENETISFNLDLHFLALVITEMQIQLYKYYSSFFLLFQFFYCSIFVFLFGLANPKISRVASISTSEAGIESCSVKQLCCKI